MSLSSDLVQDSRLDTTIRSDGITVHVFLESSTRERLVERKEYWRRERRIGRGGFGQVHLQKCIKGVNEGAVRAVKILDKPCGAKSAEKLHLELEALAKFSHQKYHSWFVQTFGWYEDIESIFIAMEYCQHGDLQTYLKDHRLGLDETRDMIRQILEGVEQMHRNDFVHRDLKPGNILIRSRPPDPWWLILADFGISKRIKQNYGPSTVKGTSGFMAPELLGLSGPAFEHTTETIKACDIWAIGEIMLQIHTGASAFRNVREFADYCAGKHSNPSIKLGVNADQACGSFLDGLMAVSPSERMTARESLHHSWLLDYSDVEGTSSTLGICEVTPETQSTTVSFTASARWTTEPVVNLQSLEVKDASPKLERDEPGNEAGIDTDNAKGSRIGRVENARAMDAAVLKQHRPDDRNPFRRGLRPAMNGTRQDTTSSETFDHRDDLSSSMCEPSCSHDLRAKSVGKNETLLELNDTGTAHSRPATPVPLRFPELWKTSSGPSVLHDVLEVKKLVKMGWPRPLVIQALEKTDYDFGKAVKYLCRPSPPAPEVILRSNPNDWSPAIKGTLSSPPQLVSPPPPPPPPAVDDFSPSHADVIASRNSITSLRRAAIDRWRQAGHALYPMSISNQARVKPIDSSKEFSRGTFAEPRRRIGDANLRKRSEDISKTAASPNFG